MRWKIPKASGLKSPPRVKIQSQHSLVTHRCSPPTKRSLQAQPSQSRGVLILHQIRVTLGPLLTQLSLWSQSMRICARITRCPFLYNTLVVCSRSSTIIGSYDCTKNFWRLANKRPFKIQATSQRDGSSWKNCTSLRYVVSNCSSLVVQVA